MRRCFLSLLLFSIFLFACRHTPAPLPQTVQAGSLKILVAEEGFYQLTLQQVMDRLSISDLNWEQVSLSTEGKQVPFTIEANKLLFYGQSSTSRYSPNRAYILQVGGENAGTHITQTTLTSSSQPLLSSVPRLVRWEENRTYKSSAVPTLAGREPWFAQTIQVQDQLEINFYLPAVADGSGRLKVGLWGATTNIEVENDHDIDLLLNGHFLGTARWDGESYYVAELDMPAGVAIAGTNSLLFDNTAPGASFLDITWLDWVEVHYAATTEPTTDELNIFPNQSGQITLSGFNQNPLVFDLTNPQEPVQLTLTEQKLPLTPDSHLVALTEQAFRTPVEMTPLRAIPPIQQADLIILTTDSLVPALNPLVAARQAQGLTVAVVAIEEVYDQFRAGTETPEGITDFLNHALQNWADPKPRYLLLVGEATYDYRHYLGNPPTHLIPPLLIPVAYSGETVSDTRLADIDGDYLPNLAVGRWAVDSPQEVANLVERTLEYEKGIAPPRALFAADGTSFEFSSFTDNLLTQTRFPGEQIIRLYGSSLNDVLHEWNAGAWLVSYTGHGSPDMWGKEELLSSEAVENLAAQTVPPIVLQFTCLTGYFAHPEIVSISETMLKHKGGPVLLVAATSLTLSSYQEPFALALVEAIQNPQLLRMGDVMQQAANSLDVQQPAFREIVDSFGLLGDPSALIVRPLPTEGG